MLFYMAYSNRLLIGYSSQTTNYVQITTSYVQSTEWHGAKIHSRSNLALYAYEAITIFFKILLVTPKSNLKCYGDRSFQVATPRLRNSIADDIRSIQNLDVFKIRLKHYFLERLLLVS